MGIFQICFVFRTFGGVQGSERRGHSYLQVWNVLKVVWRSKSKECQSTNLCLL